MAGVLLTKEQLIERHGARWYYREYAGAQFTYQRRQVEMLLTAYWNGGAVDDETHPDQGMPKSKANPAHMCNGPVYMLDLERGMEAVDLSPETRVAVRLHYGEGMTLDTIGQLLGGVAKQSAQERIDLAVSKITLAMNGGDDD